MRGTRLAGLLIALALMIVAVGCGDDDDEAATLGEATTTAAEGTTYVGEVEGTDAYIALVSDGQELQGYVSDSKDVSTWIDTADVSEGEAELSSRQGDALGEATISGSEAEGEVTVDGEDYGFSAKQATGPAGLYRDAEGELGKPGSVEVGWIVLADGSQRGGTNIVDPAAHIVVKPAPQLALGQGGVTVPAQASKLRPKKFIDPINLNR